MKRLFLLASALCVSFLSQAQLTQVVVEEVPAVAAGIPANSTTYRVYAELASPTDQLLQVYGTVTENDGLCNPMFINTTTGFYNSGFGAPTGGEINPLLIGVFPDVAFDSWVTIGRENSSIPGASLNVAIIEGNTLASAFNTAPSGISLQWNQGAYFALPIDANTFPVGPNNRVMLGQFTTDGDFSFELNVGVRISGVPGTTLYTASSCVVNPPVPGDVYIPSVPSLTFPAAAVVDGCTDPTACNFDAAANNDDGSCILPGDACDDGDATTVGDQVQPDCSCAGVTVPGCNDGTACNFDPTATVNDGSCIFPGDSCDDGDATTVGDVVLGDCSCAGVTVPGCTDLAACNYDATATVDDGSCILPGDACDDGDATTVGDQIQTDCSCAGVTVPGCTNPAACNFDNAATVDNGSCVLPGDACDDGNAATENDTVQTDCSCAGTLIAVPGCTDPLACNFDPAANQDDGSCASLDCNGECGGSAFIDGCGDCVGGSTGASAGVPGCTDPAAENFNGAATCDDNSCVFTTLNDIPAFASVLDIQFIGNCASVAGDVDQATVVAPEATATGTAGLWYSFTAVTAGARISIETADFDAVVELQDAMHNVLDVEDVNAGNGNEVLNIGSLTAGQDYFVRVAPASATAGAAQFSICAEWLPDTQVDEFPGVTEITRSLCQNTKADWVPQGGSNFSVVNYIFTYTADGFEVTTETGAAFTIMPLTNVPGLLWEGIYEVAVAVELVLADGSGVSENVVVENTVALTLNVTAPPSTNLRPADNLVNAGPLFPNAIIWATPFVCTVQQWEWEFTNAAGGLPITYFSPNFDRRIRLNWVPGLMAGEVYNVRVRPVFASGYEASFGAVDQIAIIGSIGFAPEIESPVVVDAQDAERAIEFNGPELALYPNPNNGEFVNINLSNVNSDVERIAVDIYDSFGKLVISRQIANAGSQFNVIMPLDGIAAGVYTVSIIMNDEVRTERMIVQR